MELEIENAGSQVAAIHDLVSQYQKPQLVDIAGRDVLDKAAGLACGGILLSGITCKSLTTRRPRPLQS